MIEIDGHYIVIDAIAAVVPQEFGEGSTIMLYSGASIDTDTSVQEVLELMRDALKDA